jgi:hypothetical protein
MIAFSEQELPDAALDNFHHPSRYSGHCHPSDTPVILKKM